MENNTVAAIRRDRLRCANHTLDLSTPVVMGVLNVTPDSFSDGGRFNAFDAALSRAKEMVAAGAGILDIGGESTRPGAAQVSVDDELERVLPLLHALLPDCPVPISVDTSKPEVMRAALAAGASMINDVRALNAPGALEALADSDAGVCLMHMQGMPATMQQAPRYSEVVAEIGAYLTERVAVCEDAGIGRDRLCIDPGFGFGKTLEHNLSLLAGLEVLAPEDLPVLAGLSRKSMLQALTDRPVEERLAGSLSLAALAVAAGAGIVRVHDVADSVDAVRVAAAVRAAKRG